MTSLEQIVGKNVADLRAETGLSQDDLAEKLKVKRLTVGRWERGDTLPTGQNFQALGKALGVEPWTLCMPSEQAQKALSRAKDAKLRASLSEVCRALGFNLAAKR
jgi:transcriptional regulator with XRE-family HTH domain